ncbi:hypothetical protein CRG98_029390 [Punica granatum]|uniref:RNase H type-1 domain-containing protein n=1 Tax=Punica granatum TaxID=22663 RepID=A0A2I0J1T8_PUNGR|nr:hypothetical protein CRG98_029390 [Punica granatum]
MPKALSGLGILDMNSRNKALVGSLVSRASTSREPWARLLRLQLNTRNPTDLGRASTNWKAIKVGNPGSAGAGGLIRDSLGRWVGGFRMNLGCTTSLITELKALRQRLIIAAECGASKLIVELDAKLVLDWVWGNTTNRVLTNLIDDCRSLCQQFDVILPKHTYREANKCADHLANLGVDLPDCLVSLTYPPPSLRKLLFEDAMGLTSPRTVSAARMNV